MDDWRLVRYDRPRERPRQRIHFPNQNKHTETTQHRTYASAVASPSRMGSRSGRGEIRPRHGDYPFPRRDQYNNSNNYNNNYYQPSILTHRGLSKGHRDGEVGHHRMTGTRGPYFKLSGNEDTLVPFYVIY